MPRYGRREYDEGYDAGYQDAMRQVYRESTELRPRRSTTRRSPARRKAPARKKARKLSAWQRFIKNKRNHIKFKSGKDKGKLNLKAMARKYRKTPAGRKKR